MSDKVHPNGSVSPADMLAMSPAPRQPSSLRDKIELRIAMQDTVAEFVRLRREDLWRELVEEHPEWDESRVQRELGRLQPDYGPEYDPVVHLATMAVDHRNAPELRRQAAAEAAQYVRPKLKSIEMRVDADSPEQREQKQALFDQLRGLLDASAMAKRATTIDGTARPSPVPSAGESDSVPSAGETETQGDREAERDHED